MRRYAAAIALVLWACAECPRGEVVDHVSACGGGCASAAMTRVDVMADPPCGRPSGAICLGEDTGAAVSGLPGCVVGASGTIYVTHRVLDDDVLGAQSLRRCDRTELELAQSANVTTCGEAAP